MLYNTRIENSILDNYRIVTIVNSNYLKIFDIWYHYFVLSGYESILRVITLDKRSDTYLANKSIKTIYKKRSIRDFSKIILIRWEIIYELLEQGINVINADADAIWLKPDINRLINSQYDIQVSIAYGIPVRAVSQWGFTLCTGFMVLQSNRQVKKFLREWIKLCMEIGDDQIAFNTILLNSDIEWQLSSKMKNNAFVKNLNLEIEAIDYRLVSRDLFKDIVVFHPYLPENHQNFKIVRLVRYLDCYKHNPEIMKIWKRTIYNPMSWINSTYGWVVFSYYKALNKFKMDYLR